MPKCPFCQQHIDSVLEQMSCPSVQRSISYVAPNLTGMFVYSHWNTVETNEAQRQFLCSKCKQTLFYKVTHAERFLVGKLTCRICRKQLISLGGYYKATKEPICQPCTLSPIWLSDNEYDFV